MSNREIFIDKLKQLSKEEMLERYIALLNTEKLTDYVADLETKLAESNDNVKLLAETRVAMCDTIKDLETKLAESESKAYALESYNNFLFNQYKRLIKENKQFKQQLAEKDEELEEKTDALKELRQKCFEEQKEHLQETADIYRKLAEYDQDKISFCIEKLEKVKNIINNNVKNINKRLDDLNIKIVCESTSKQLDTYEEISKEIDNQINELKGVK